MTRTARPKVHPPYRSGFCNPANPRSSHDRCEGYVIHADGQTSPCICEHHQLNGQTLPTEVTPDPPELRGLTMDQAVDLVAAAAGRLDKAAAGPGLGALGWEPAVDLLARLRAATALLSTLDSLLVGHIYRHGPYGETTVEGLGVINVRRSKDRRSWDDRGLAQAILDTHLSETGEQPMPWDVVDWLLEAAGISYWRTGALKAQGIDPDQFCATSSGKPTVQLPKRT